MSDLEAVRHAHDATITELAGGKLRSLANSSIKQPAVEGILDGFAEVFARMSEAKIVPIDEQSQQIVEDSVPVAPESGEEDVQTETQHQNQEHTDCVAPEWEDLPTDEVVVVSSQMPEQTTFQESGSREDEETESLLTAEPETVLATEAKFEESLAEVENRVVEQEEVRGVVPIENVEEGWSKQRDTTKTVEARTAEVSPVVVLPERDRGAAEKQEMDADLSTLEDQSEQQPLEAVGETRRQRRQRHRAERVPEAKASISSQQGQQHSSSNAKIPISPEMLEAAAIMESSPTDLQERSADRVGNRLLQLASVANSTVSASAAGNARSAANTGAGGRTSAFNPSAAGATKVGDRPVNQSSSNKAENANTLTRVKLIQRVSKAFQHLGPEGGVIRLRLAPAEMGSVRVEMRIQQRKVAARVVAETEAASATLREHLPDLRAKLESFGMQVEQLEIETENLDHDRGSQFSDSRFNDTSDRDDPWQNFSGDRQRDPMKKTSETNSSDVSQDVSSKPVELVPAEGIDVHL